MPKAIEDPGLLLGEACDVVGTAQPFDVRMASRHAAGGTGYVGEDAVEGLPVPPVVELAAIGDAQAGLQAEALEVLVDAPGALRIEFDGGEGDVAVLEDVGGLSARGGAGVEHALPGGEIEELGDPLGGDVLHRHQSGLEARQAGDRHGLGEQQGIVGLTAGVDAGLAQALLQRGRVGAATVWPQRHGRMHVARGEHRLPLLRVGRSHGIDPPRRVTVMRLRLERGGAKELFAAAQIVAQHPVGERAEVAAQ